MCWKEDKKLMLKSYELLYEIEMIIVHHIVDCYQKRYQLKWMYHLDTQKIKTATYRDLLFFIKSKRLIFSHIKDSQLQTLKELAPIRNKICHMQPILEEEFDFLKKCHRIARKLQKITDSIDVPS